MHAHPHRILTALTFAALVGVSTPALAQAVDQLGANEAIFVDGQTFSIAKGAAKQGAGAPQQLAVRELGAGTIIYRQGDKLYLAEAPARTAGVGKDFQDGWKSAMKNFQDDWKSNMRNFQDNWKSNFREARHAEEYKSAMKTLDAAWVSYMQKMPEEGQPTNEERAMAAMKSFQDEWKSDMKTEAQKTALSDFQDQWKSYVKDFQDRWKNNMKYAGDQTGSDTSRGSVLKEFQDRWQTSYAK